MDNQLANSPIGLASRKIGFALCEITNSNWRDGRVNHLQEAFAEFGMAICFTIVQELKIKGESMNNFRKKPVVVEAVRLNEDGRNMQEIQNFFGSFTGWHTREDGVVIRTLEGDHLAEFGDWIIKGVKGEFYPCKPDIFEMTYEPVEKE